VRKSAVETLFRLKNRFREEDLPVYLEFETVRPYLERGMKESSAEHRDVCLEFILSYERQDRLYLITAATESKDAAVRYEALRGLSRFGMKYLRVFLLGLTDSSDSIRG
jgi:hypothetical protein